MLTLSDNQARALRAIAESGDGVAIRTGTARALERRRLIEIRNAAPMSSGVTARLTKAGTVLALELWHRYNADFEAKRGKPSAIAQGVIARLERQ
jgi:hypothetical protein